ncbi:MAG: dicarboxylate/amino acid:cation symporter [Methanosarcinaceae archaeon]|nr:dicarboxylate/amino acid:cation symporter [Methanosarcinaceae archaeon]MDD4497572.1 dicarboxylate/amino acid:cation symporter [Methanosarcinaceae archaeon]
MFGINRRPDPVRRIHPHSLKRLSHHLLVLLEKRLWLQILLGMGLGLSVGLALGPFGGLLDETKANVVGEWLSLPGYIFLRLLQMIVVPLIFASIIRGIAAGSDTEQLRKIGVRILGYFLFTTAIAICIGIGISLLIKPGLYISSELLQGTLGSAAEARNNASVPAPTISEVPELIGQLVPKNPLGSMAEGEMLQVVIFSIIFGIALVSMAPKQSKPLLDLLGSLQEVCMTVVRWSMLLAPVAVFGLLANFTIKLGVGAIVGMAVYVGTVLLSLLVLLGFYMVIVLFVSKRNPIKFLMDMRELMLLAFSTSSSAAVMPVSIKTAEEKMGVRPSVSQFVIPIGATVNMDGTALYQGVATVFLAQVFGVELGFGGLILIMLTTVGASIGTPAAPGVGIIILAIILNSVGIPTAGIALIIGVDRVLDMSRTAVNVTGDVVACTVMDRWVGGRLSAQAELARESRRNLLRSKEGEDVIVDENSRNSLEE